MENGRGQRELGGYADAAYNAVEVPAGGMSFGQALRSIRQRWWLVVIALVVIFGAAWFLVPDDVVVYRASAVVRMDDARRALIGGLDGGPVANIRSTEFMVSQVHVIQSRALVGDVVDREGLRLQPSLELPSSFLQDIQVEGDETAGILHLQFGGDSFTVTAAGRTVRARYGEPLSVGGARFTLASAPSAADAEAATLWILPREAAIDHVLTGLASSPREGAAIIDIRYTGSDPVRAQAVVNTVAVVFQEHNTRGVQEAARTRREFIEEQWLLAEQRLAAAQRDLTDFRNQGQRLYSPQQRLQLEQSGVLALDTQRDQLEAERRLYTAFLERIENATDDMVDAELRTLATAPDLSAGPLLSQLFSQLTQYQGERERLLAGGAAPTHPEVERLTRLMSSARASVVDAARTQVASLDLRISILDDQRQRSASVIQSIPNYDGEDSRLEQEVALASSAASTLRGEYYRARIAESIDVGQAEILDFATTATPQVRGKRTQKLVLALFFGLMLGGGSALAIEASNTSIRWRRDMEDMAAVPGLGVIPHFGDVPATRRSNRLFRRGETSGQGNAAVATEAYRLLRTNLTFQPDTKLNTLVVTSASSGEGKTTTAANLAASFAHQELRVLLVDCDLRRPRLHRVFEIEESPGFIELLLGDATASAAIRKTPVEGLYVMPRGKYDSRAPEMLGGLRVKQIMAAFAQHYDIVVLDTPPVLAAADAAALAAISDGVLLVVRAGRTSRDAAREAMQQLQGVGSNVVGFVLNDPDSIAGRYGEYAYAEQYYAHEA